MATGTVSEPTTGQTAQTNLETHAAATGTSVHGLGTASTHATSDYDAAGAASGVQSNLTTHANLTSTAHGGIIPDPTGSLAIALTNMVNNSSEFVGPLRNPFYFVATPDDAANAPYLILDLALAPAGFWTHVTASGGEIRVTTQDGVTQVARKIVNFNKAAHTGTICLAPGGGTAFRVYYGGVLWTEPAASSTYGAQNAWGANAKLALPGDSYIDETAAGRAATPTAGVSIVDGKFAMAIRTTANTDIITLPHTTPGGVSLTFTNLSVSMWVYFDSRPVTASIIRKGNFSSPYFFGLILASHAPPLGIAGDIQVSIQTGGDVNTDPGVTVTGQWYHIGFSSNGSTGAVVIYLNGTAIKTGSSYGPPAIPAAQLCLGNRDWDLGQPFYGKMEQIVFWDAILTADQFSCLNSQGNQGDFWSIGTETNA